MVLVTNNVSFAGIRRAEYNLRSVDRATHAEENKKVTLYELEHRDIPVLEKLIDKAAARQLIPEDAFKGKDSDEKQKHSLEWHSITKGGFKHALKSLKLKFDHQLESIKTVSYLVVVDKKPCGIVVGNIPRISMEDQQIYYSDRKRNNETQLDILSSWPLKQGNKLVGTGSAMMTEFFKYFNEKGSKDFDTLYLQSSAGQNTSRHINATKFYEKMGFEKLGNLISTIIKGKPRKLTDIYGEKQFKPFEGQVQPYVISQEKAKQKSEELQTELHRKDLDNKSIDLEKELQSI